MNYAVRQSYTPSEPSPKLPSIRPEIFGYLMLTSFVIAVFEYAYFAQF